MTITHESGHVVAGWLSGGTLKAADLLPWHLPFSIFDPDPNPLLTLWGGLLLGIAVPLGLAFLIQREWMWFIANFCVLANGAYIAIAWLLGDRFLDTPKMLELGASPITMCIYCLTTIGFGYVGFRRSCIHVLSSTSARDGDERVRQSVPGNTRMMKS